MKEKVKCKKCGLLIDDDMQYCPYCGYVQDQNENQNEKKENKDEPFIQTSINSNLPKERGNNVFAFESKVLDLPLWKKIASFLLGYVGLQIIVQILKLFISTETELYFIISGSYSGAVNFGVYIILFGLFIILFNDDLFKILKEFKSSDTWISGLAYGFLVLIISSAINAMLNLIPHSGVNNNESSIDSITTIFPLLSLLVFGLIGPICEEFTYRVGFFGFFRKINPILGYIFTAILFGFIHFDFQSNDLINELINIPSYIIAGLMLCYIYDYKGIGTSIIAHALNNVTGILLQIILYSM